MQDNQNFKAIVPPVNDSPYERILAIGDVHAAYDKLQSLWKKLNVTEKDLVIFLGDYLYGMGEGEKNIETLHWLIEHRKQKNIIFLRGNVDETYLHSLFDEQGKFFWKLNSRIARHIKTTAVKEPNFPEKIFDFLKNLPLSYTLEVGGKKFFFCHAGIKVDVPLERQPKKFLLDHPQLKDFYRDYSGEAVIVVGHKSPKKIFKKLPRLFTEEPELKPLKVPNRNIVMLDTHAKKDGPLSCVDIISGKFFQSNDEAQAESADGIIFVCSGNTCRSPMAKYIMRRLLAEKNLSDKMIIDSAGCNTHGGSPLSRGARDVLKEKNIPFDAHVSKKFTKELYQKFKVIVTLDNEIFYQAKEISGGDPENKIRLFKDFAGRVFNVADPYRTGDYRKAYVEIYLFCSMLLKELT